MDLFKKFLDLAEKNLNSPSVKFEELMRQYLTLLTSADERMRKAIDCPSFSVLQGLMVQVEILTKTKKSKKIDIIDTKIILKAVFIFNWPHFKMDFHEIQM